VFPLVRLGFEHSTGNPTDIIRSALDVVRAEDNTAKVTLTPEHAPPDRLSTMQSPCVVHGEPCKLFQFFIGQEVGIIQQVPGVTINVLLDTMENQGFRLIVHFQ
jgi:hypothetical protein